MSQVVRFGILGAARITPPALIAPCAQNPRAQLVAVAARDRRRAVEFASEHHVPDVSADYAELVRRDDVDAIYNALPASLHAPWTIEALRAGKHVLCEKPFALNADEAREMVQVADELDLELVEAFHWRYHPISAAVYEVFASGRLGKLRRLEARFCVPIPDQTDIRYDLALGGGATMDLGCYPIHWLRTWLGSEPRVVSAQAKQDPPGIDVEMTAELIFQNEISASVHCAMHPEAKMSAELRAHGDHGELEVFNPLAPHLGNRLLIRDASGETTEMIEGRTTYEHQLDAFIDLILHAQPVPTGGEDAIGNMAVIDAMYAAAGLPPRG